jgi:hypothetical protein
MKNILNKKTLISIVYLRQYNSKHEINTIHRIGKPYIQKGEQLFQLLHH